MLMCNILVTVRLCTSSTKCKHVHSFRTSYVSRSHASTQYVRKMCTLLKFKPLYLNRMVWKECKIHNTFLKCYCAIYCYPQYYVLRKRYASMQTVDDNPMSFHSIQAHRNFYNCVHIRSHSVCTFGGKHHVLKMPKN